MILILIGYKCNKCDKCACNLGTRRGTWEDLLQKPKVERKMTGPKKKTFQTHLLTSEENQAIIRRSAAETDRKTKIKKEKEEVVKAVTKAYQAEKCKNARKSALPRKIKSNPKL